MIASQKAPTIIEEFPDAGPHEGGTGALFRVLWRSKRYRYGVVAQFANVAAQVCAWTYLIQYVQQALGGSLEKGGAYLQLSLLVFLASRFLMTWVIGRVRATKVLAVLAFLAVLLCVFAMVSPNLAGVLAVVALSFCLSLMFPTIYGVALKGLGPATKFGAAGLVMAIVGGAIMPLVQGKLVDETSPAISFIVPAVCFVVVGLYALYDLRAGAGHRHRETRHDRPPHEPRRSRPSRPGDGPGLTLAVSACGADDADQRRRRTRAARGRLVVDLRVRGRRAGRPARPRSGRPTRASTPVNAAVAGGAGSQAIVALAKRLQKNDPPDVWQTFAGQSVQGYADRGAVRDVDVGLVGGDLRATMHPTILQSLMHDGKPYGVPTGAHRSNVLWFNTGAAREGRRHRRRRGGYTLAAFLDDLRKVKASGATPLCLGGKDPFTTVELFENILLSTIGTNGWRDMAGDRSTGAATACGRR